MKKPRIRNRVGYSPLLGRTASAVLWLIVLLSAIAAILCYKAFETNVDSRIRLGVYLKLSEMFPNTRVVFRRVTMDEPNRIVVHGVRMVVKVGAEIRTILTIDRMELTGDLDISHVVQETIRVRQVDLFSPQANLWQTDSGDWSLFALTCKSDASQPPPTICVHDGQLRIFRDPRSKAAPIVVHDISGKMASNSADPSSNLVQGKFQARSSGNCESVDIHTSLDRVNQNWSIQGSIRDISFTRDLVAKFPNQLSRALTQVAGLSCKASALFEVSKTGSQADPSFRVEGKLEDGRLQDVRLPYPLEELSGNFYCEDNWFQLRKIRARSGQASIKFDADIKGFHPQAPAVILAEATMLQLDARLYDALPEKWRTYWDRIQPEGFVDAKVTLSSDGLTWKPRLEIACRDVQLECWLFPYPLTNVQGQVVLATDFVEGVGLHGRASGQPINGGFRFQCLDSEWYGKMEVKGVGWSPIDEKLIAAMTVRGQPKSSAEKFLSSLRPTGAFRIQRAYFERPLRPNAAWHKELDLQIEESSIVYDYFQYPLHRIRGRILAVDDDWRLEGFEGWNDTGRIECNGQWRDSRTEGVSYQLAFTGHSLAMEDRLKNALPLDARKLWEQIQPSGTLDRAEVSIVRPTGAKKAEIEVALHEDNNTNLGTGQALRLYPKSFPYWLSDVACDLTYRPGFLSIAQASASNGNSRVSLKAQCQQNVAGNWVGTVDWLPSSRVQVNTQLLRALPETISGGLIELDLRGPVNIVGKTNFELPIDSSATLTTNWNMQLDLEDVQVGEGKVVDGIRGTLRLVGHRDSVQLAVAGWATVDAVSFRGVPVTKVQGPLALVGDQVFFGTEVAGHVDPNLQLTIVPVTADALSGLLSVSGSGQLDTGRFQIKSTLANADLRCMLQDLGASQAPTDARCQAELNFAGVPWQSQTYSGNGAIHLSDAKLYQLPTMIQLMRKLSISPSDGAAFHTADIKFAIDGDRIPLELACEGDLLSLRGSGWTNLRKELELDLYSYVGGRRPITTILSPLIADSRYATFMKLEVNGSLDNPQIERHAFPQLDMRQQIFPDKVAGQERETRLFSRLRHEHEESMKTAAQSADSGGPIFR